MKKTFVKFTKSRFAITSAILTAITLICLYLEYFLIMSDVSPILTFIGVGVFYILLSVLVYSIIKAKSRTKISEKSDIAVSSEIPMTLYNHVSMPIAYCLSDGTIAWGNNAFRSIFEISGAPNRIIDIMLGYSLESLCNSENGLLWESANKKYKVSASIADSLYTVVTWNDITELESVRKRFADEEPLFAVVVLDNIDEVAQIDSGFATNAAAKINSVLIEWAESVDGVIKEHDRGKYLFAFSAKHLTDFLESQFSILDKVRSIGKDTNDSSANTLSVTISIGIGAVSGSISEKEKASRSALELALARGGDQAVLKNESGVQYYGGVTKTSQKRSTVRSRIVANKLAELIKDSSAVFVMGHKYADFDAFGACVGVARLASFLGKECYILCDAGNRNLTKCYEIFADVPEYEGILINSSEAKELKSSENPLLVIVDVNNIDNFEYPELAETFARKIFIDHHRMAGELPFVPLMQYIEPSSSSTCELICEILEQSSSEIKLLKEEADIMLAGIMLDTKKFVLNTGVRTFSAAQYLRGQGADPSSAQAYFKADIDSMQREARFESNIQIYKKVIAISIVDEPCSNEDRIPAAKAADSMLSIDGILASFAVCRIVNGENNTVRISARSTGKINVQLIMEKLGGGGHYDQAASETASVSLQEMLIRLKESIDLYLAENPQILTK